MTPSVATLLGDLAGKPTEAAAIAVDGGPELTYRDWDARSAAVAAGLRSAGIASGDRVALLFDNRRWTDYVVAYTGVIRLGAVAIPFSTVLSSLEVVRLLRHSGAAAVVAPQGLAPDAPRVAVLTAERLEESPASGVPDPGVARGPVEILHVSRPLAAPVAVERPMAALLDRWRVAAEAAGAGGVLLHWWPVGAAAGQDAVWAALHGVRLRVLPEFDVSRVIAQVGARAATACSLHPATAGALLEATEGAAQELRGLRGLVLASGRVQPWLRRRLQSQLPWARVLTTDAHEGSPPPPIAAGAARAPRPEVRTAVAAAWRRMVGAAQLSPGVQVTRVLRLVEDALDVRVPVQALLATPTEDGLCTAAERALDDRGSLPPDDRDGPAPAAFSQEGMIWHECFAPGCQNLPGLARRFRGPLDVASLRRALDEIVRRHQPLRSTFATSTGRLVQVVRPPAPVPLEVIDLSVLAPADRAAAVDDHVAAAGAEPFDLVDGPLFVPTLLRVAPDEHVLVIRTHHSVFDDWSVGVFRRQLGELYAAYSTGRDPQLPTPSAGFAAFAREQRRRLAGSAGAEEIEYWRAQLSGSPLTTQLPVQDPAAPPGSGQRPGGPLTASLGDHDRDAVQNLARHERTTVFAVVLAAFAALTGRITGQPDLLLSTVVANRNSTGVEPLIGCFTKKVPLRLDLRGDPAFTELISRTRTALLGALAHQDLPFEAVVQEVLGPRAAEHGLVPHPVVMVQGVTPRQELVLPAVDTQGFNTSTRAPRAHFMADARTTQRESSVPWGAGLYLGTFVILSVAADDGDVCCTLRGAFDDAAGSQLLDAFGFALSEVVAHPDRRLSQLRVPAATPLQPAVVDVGGFPVDTARIAEELRRCAGVREAAVRIVEGGQSVPRLEADVVPASQPPGDSTLRACLWRHLPGYAWPATIHPVARVGGQGVAAPATAGETDPHPAVFESVLGAMWAETLGIERCLPGDNYWQDFSFLEALARARDAGVRVPSVTVTRNRTLLTLATALAAEHDARRVPEVPGV